MSRRLLAATALISSAALLAACTPSGSGTGENASNNGSANTEQASPSISVVDAKGKEVKTVKAGQHLTLRVENGTFASASASDSKQKDIPVDKGSLSSGADADEAESTAAPSAQNAGFTAANRSSTSDSELEDSDADSTASASQEAGASDGSSEGASAAPSAGASDDAGSGEHGTTWTSDFTVAGNSTYEWKATVKGNDGQSHEETGTVKTSEPSSETTRTFTEIADDDTVGVAAPVIVNFSGIVPKKYRASIQNRMTVQVTDNKGKKRSVTGAWGWLPDDDGHSSIHYRTEEHWPAHSKVTVKLPMKGVQTSDETYGKKNVTLDFKIGRSQIVKASAKTHRMTVTRDGKKLWDWPASLGKPSSPSYNGEHIVMSKSADYTMTSERYGYSTPVQWAVRIHNNGEFVHAAPWSEGVQGSSNVSHGCINLSTSRAAKYFASAKYGDPVSITGSRVSLTPDSGDVSDWTYSWKQWQKLSAIKS
ncbi:L,D-transpeptidase family protein [Brevibacterium sp. 5221]|uniref:L,D-transpeptidase family protein n=1 Tax=Brevibacterium rongguiense TaxID=2695267 RepID=A0A6N9H5Q1_9MICO|nr:Ig-like domain-containing protein [Brevibacterium rongguiense]MYM19205.1 L,D-transpeptidase family protein [Brevibacterium rongguiense]